MSISHTILAPDEKRTYSRQQGIDCGKEEGGGDISYFHFSEVSFLDSGKVMALVSM